MLSKFLMASVLGLSAVAAHADAGYPNKNIVLVTPFPPGSTSDLIPRLVAPLMSQSMGVTVVVENRAGANGSLGAARVATAAPDGYTLLMATTGVLAINQWIYPKLQYAPDKDFEPVINAASTPNMLVVNPSVKASTLKELVALAKAQPNTLTYASAGNGSTSHLCGESLKVASGVDIVHVPYQGPAPAMQDVLSGRVSMICDNLSNVIQNVRAGRLRAIAVTGKEASPQAPGVPTSAQAGVPDLEAGIWYSFVAPAGTPKAVVDRLNTEFSAALKDPTVTSRLESLGLSIVADKPEQFKAFIADEAARMQKVVAAAGARVQ
ncbi:Bug family tripartite tricarboxylate transporter substrate binding protein [Pigmentiphaga litoralis]|uniref:Tripartite-type tricarboxylate transporter receptor subunit TctC n=1 Tax=Pigmentiphaga litoralis TaxID=516702 RepID=A0A7Y9IYC8_9BURK|nr:tripartite tricarboxylate transporter substrate binding protein [Pigmentiphaga litoralis]NYE26265.1 tripartite-type tricarboxylate transporter receptor subunit TctC [Pigmentiphaga litoralis]NYE85385.1 tripartite-type tricarboxylate transporter receptor subunit TctC [Pigmentiphaga litoralis]